MHFLTRKSALLCACAAVAAAELVVPAAGAVQEVPPAPTSTPAQGTLPGVVPERFSLAPPRPTPAPTPEPTTPAPTPTPSPSPRAALTPSAPERRTPERVEPSMPASQPTPERSAPVIAPSVPVDAPLTQPASTPAVVAPSPEKPSAPGVPGWLWALAGGGVVALGFGAHHLLRRRRAEQGEAISVEQDAAPDPAVPAPRPAPPAPVAPPARAVPAQALQPSAEPFEIALRLQRLTVATEEVVLEVEVLLGNRQSEAAENVRVHLTMLSANPDQDRHAAAFHAATLLGDGAVPPFDLSSGAGGRIPIRLSLPREALHVVQLGGRPMFVPMVLVDLRWRSGISIRRFGADFLAGTPGQGDKLGPIWLDRPVAGALAAARYLPRPAVAA